MFKGKAASASRKTYNQVSQNPRLRISSEKRLRRKKISVTRNLYEGSLWRYESSFGNLLRDHRARFRGDLLNINENKVNIDSIQTLVCKFYKISKNEMLSPRRSRYLVRPRQTAIYLSKMLTSKSLPEIGRAFSNRDHTTVIHSVKTIEKLRKEDNELNMNIDSLKNKILYNKENEV